MTDPITTSKSARESLARGLNALQADPSVPPQLVELAAPIAQAMGALHQIERTQQLAPHAEVALSHVRGALGQLQAANSTHPAVRQALEAVATSLSLVHSLTRMANGPVAAPPQAAPAQAPPQHTQEMAQKPVPAPQPPPPQPQQYQQPQPQPHQPQPQPQHQPQQQQQPRANPQPSFPQGAPPGGGMVARDPFAAPPTGGHGAPLAAQMHQQPGGAPATPSMPVPAPPAGNLQLVSADLGAHSATNFYKGLSGNDIFDHGGLFVSTYVLPKLNTAVRLKVSLPGGYEFEANALVKWTREDGGDDAPPGFGAAFTAITPEAKQLVLRYVRNREPILYDDF